MSERKLTHGQRIAIRQMAVDANEKTYSTGEPCKNGHISPRSTASRHCLACDDEYEKERAVRRRAKNHPNISYQEALAEGRIKYMSDTACPKGHIDERYVKDHSCVPCKREYRARMEAQREQKIAQEFKFDPHATQTLNRHDVTTMISKLTIATELLFYAEVCDVDTGEIAKNIIRAFDKEIKWWLPLTTMTLAQLLEVFKKQTVEQEPPQYHADAANTTFSISTLVMSNHGY